MADGYMPINRSLAGQQTTPRPGRTYGATYGAEARGEPRPTPSLGTGAAPTSAAPASLRQASTDTEKTLRRILIIIIAVLALIVVLELAFQLAVAPQLHIQKIALDSDVELTKDELLSAAGIGANERFYAIDPQAIETRLRAIPAVQEATVSPVFPDTLSIRLRSRQALVVSLMRREDSTQVPVLIDALGMAFHVGLIANQEDLPVLTGIEFRNFRPGLQLPHSVVPFLQDLQALRQHDPQLFHAFSEFRLMPVGTGQVEVLAYTISSPVGVRINARLSPEGALYILRTLDMITHTVGMAKIREIDFRTNNVVYKKGDD